MIYTVVECDYTWEYTIQAVDSNKNNDLAESLANYMTLSFAEDGTGVVTYVPQALVGSDLAVLVTITANLSDQMTVVTASY